MNGSVTFVGAGPGDAAWITCAGLAAIRSADVLVVDALVSPLLVAEAPWSARVIDVGKRGGLPSADQEQINALLVREASAGQQVVRLKGGDAGTFGRLAEELAAVRGAGLAFAVIPGVTAAGGAAARLAMPLTDRDLAASLTLLTGHRRTSGPQPDMDWAAASRSGTVCVYMGVLQAAENVARLLAAGVAPTTPVAVVSRATTPRERVCITTLDQLTATLERERIRPPALWLVGAAMANADVAYAAKTRSRGMVALLRPQDRDDTWRTALSAAGYAVLATPLQRIAAPHDAWAGLAGAATTARPQPWLVVTSPLAAEWWLRGERECGLDVRRWADFSIAAVGPGTAQALAAHGLRAAWVGGGGAAVIVAHLRDHAATTAVWLAAADADTTAPAALTAAGWDVRRVVSHRKEQRGVPAALALALAYDTLDAVVWTSPSQVAALYGACAWGRVRHVSIGGTTTAALRAAGCSDIMEAPQADHAGVTAALHGCLQ